MENAGWVFFAMVLIGGLTGDRLHDILGFHEFLAAFADTHVDDNLVNVDIAHRGHSSIPHFAIAGVCFPTM